MRKSRKSLAAAGTFRHPRGFSLMEMLVTLLIFSLLAGAIITVLVVSTKQKSATSNEVTSTDMARTAMDMLSRDLRTAGFGVDNTYTTPQPPIAYVDSLQILINADVTPYPDTSSTARGIPLAYDPNGSPRPKPLDGTSWTPVIRYRTGAETIRWTLDLNNDGQVNATDLGVSDAADANRTPNPNDYELCREVYGDNTGGSLGNNGGTRERVALLKKPGGSQPPLFRVYMEGSSTPWDWSNGPVPANRLQEIVRVEINVVATSPTRNFLGQYSDARLSTTVNEIRNSPNFSFITYNVSGTVFNDPNKNNLKDVGETGVSGALVTLGGYLSVTTGASGTFSFDVPPGSYVLKQDPPSNYGIFTAPDSFKVTVGPAVVKNFADTLRQGGWVTVTVYNDVDKNHSYGGSDKPMLDLALTLVGSKEIYSTDGAGQAAVFAPVGTYQISAALPDSFVFSTANPISGTMTNGGVKTGAIGMYVYDSGTVSGTVYNDTNGNGVLDGGEKGVPSATVSCILPDSTVLYTYTDGTGKYALKLPVNDPPKTTPYTVICTPPSGFALGNNIELNGIYVQSNKIVANQNFPLGKYALWQKELDAPMTAIAAADFIENDWTGTATKHARQDLDLVTGSDQTVSSSVEQWFNQYDKAPPFLAQASIIRSSAMTVNALTTDTLNAASGGLCRPDLVAGMRYKAGTNFAVWLTQNGTGNEGYLPTTPTQTCVTSDNGDVTSVATIASATAGNAPDIIVGTQSPATGQGVIEVWKSASHTTPSYTRSQTIPPSGALPGNNLGAVAGVVMAEIDKNVAGKEMVVGTQTGYYSGQIIVFKQVAGAWTLDWSVTLASDAVTAITVVDVNDDGKLDIVVGTQTSHTAGHLMYYKNNTGGTIAFATPVIQTPPGLVNALAHGDFSGDGIDDIVVGWRATDVTYPGGLQIWYTDSKNLPASGVDPSAGKIAFWVTAIVVGDFNYGTWPSSPNGTPLVDIACVTRKDLKHSQLFTLMR